MSEIHICLQNAGITFNGTLPPYNAIKNLLRWRTRSKQLCLQSQFSIEALKDISIDIKSGERVGLIGPNGAGKSTLLKVMAGIYPPTKGWAKTSGKVCPLFEMATGFEMNQTGWDNIRIRGMLLGMTPPEIEEKLGEIEEFSELGDFLDRPVRTYSSGMFIRLAFTVSTCFTPEVLLIDEIIGAGDLSFANKAKQRMRSFIERGEILVFSTHNLELLANFCERTIWLDKGVIVLDGCTKEVLHEYQRRTLHSQTP